MGKASKGRNVKLSDTYIEPLEKEETRDEIRVILNHKGIGDLVTCAYAVAGIKARTDKRVVWSVVEKRKEFAELFQDADEVVTHERPNMVHRVDAFEKSTPVRLNAYWTRHQQYAKKLGTKLANPRFAKPAPYDWSQHGLSVPPVLIVPESTQSIRMWSHDPGDTDTRWIELAKRLEAEGIPVVALCSKDFGRSVKAANPREMLSIINSASVIISVDTGPAHVAGMLGKYTVALMGVDSGPGVFGHYDRVRAIQGKAISGKQCSPCHRDPKRFKGLCNEWCQALSEISVDEVFGEVLSILSGVKTCH